MLKLGPYFETRLKGRLHIAQIILIILVIILTGVRISITDVPVTRASVMGIVMVGNCGIFLLSLIIASNTRE